MKNAFYFKLQYLKFILFSRFDIWFMCKNELIRRIRLNSKFMTSKPGQQKIAIHILPNISRNKGNQTKKFGQLIECNLRNIFIKKSYTKCGGETVPRPFSFISGSKIESFLQFVFVACQVEDYKNTLKLGCRPLVCNSFKAFLKNKKRSGTNLLALFPA